MEINYSQEFETVDLIVNSSTRTRAVDAFALSLIKSERQIRKLVTHLVYQFPCFGPTDIPALRRILVNYRQVYFDGFERGFNALYPRAISDLVGHEYSRLRDCIRTATENRNKIFHGQLTSKSLSRDDLLALVRDIRVWCSSLADATSKEFQYDGFGWNSFQKSVVKDLSKCFKVHITTIAEYDDFVRQYMRR